MNTDMQDRLHNPYLTFIVACSSDPNLTLILIITLNLTLAMILPKNTLLLSRVVLDINSIPLKKGSLQTSAGQLYSSAAPLWVAGRVTNTLLTSRVLVAGGVLFH